MVKFTYIHHQFSLLDYNDLRPRTRIPIRRISKARMEEALKELRRGKSRNIKQVLRTLNDDLERYCNKHGI
jgi:hypothetical protein